MAYLPFFAFLDKTIHVMVIVFAIPSWYERVKWFPKKFVIIISKHLLCRRIGRHYFLFGIDYDDALGTPLGKEIKNITVLMENLYRPKLKL